MIRYGIFKNDSLVYEAIFNKESFQVADKLTKDTGEKHEFRVLQFKDLPENEKLLEMTRKLESVDKVVSDMRDSRDGFYSNISINVEELRWLVDKASSVVNAKATH